MSKKGSLIVISGPAGSGKGTIVNYLLEDPNYTVSISTTSRQPRADDIPGVTYNFVTSEDFIYMIENGELAEFAEYVGNFYGTPVKNITKLINSGKNVILEIETQGALQIKSKFPDAILIWLTPPDYSTLESRLRNRNTNTEADIKKRLMTAKREMQYLPYYDYVVVNEKDMARKAAECIKNIVEISCMSTKNNKNFITKFYNN